MRLICRTSIDCGHHIADCAELLTKKCAQSHGHTYNFEIRLEIDILKRYYAVNFVDFELLKRDVVNHILGKYDHKNITEVFNIYTVEQFAVEVKSDILKFYAPAFNDVMDSEMFCQLEIFETVKWGVELVD